MPWLQDYLNKSKEEKKEKSTSDSQPLGQSTREGYVFTDKRGNKTIVKPFDESSASKNYEQQKQKILSKYQNNPNVNVSEHNGKISAVYFNKSGKPVYVEETDLESKQSYINRSRSQYLSAVAKFKPKPMKTKTITKTITKTKERPASGVISEKPYHGESLFPSSSASPTQKQFQTIHAVHTYISSAEATAIQRAQHAESRKEWLINAGKAAALAPANIVTGLADIPGQLYFKLHNNEPAAFYSYKANIAKSTPEMFALEAGEGFVASSVANVHAISAELSPAVVEQRQLVTIEKRVATPQMETVYGKAQTVTKADVGFGHSTITTESEFVKSIPKSDNLISERSFAVAGKRGSISTVAYSEKVNSIPTGNAKISYSERIGSGIASDIDTFSDKTYSFVSKSIGVESGGRGQFFEAGKLRSGFGVTKYSKYTLLSDETTGIHVSTMENAGSGNPTNFKVAGGFTNSFVSPAASSTSLTKAAKITSSSKMVDVQSFGDIAAAKNIAVVKNIAVTGKVEKAAAVASTISVASPLSTPKASAMARTASVQAVKTSTRQISILKPSSRAAQLQPQRVKVKVLSSTGQRASLKTSSLLASRPAATQKQSVSSGMKFKQAQGLRFGAKISAAASPFSGSIISTLSPSPIIPAGIGGKRGKSGKSSGLLTFREKKIRAYEPSLGALVFRSATHKKMKSKIFSGFEIRPMVLPKKKKKRRKR